MNFKIHNKFSIPALKSITEIDVVITRSENLTVFPEECLGRYMPTRFRRRRRPVPGRGGDLRRELPLEHRDLMVRFFFFGFLLEPGRTNRIGEDRRMNEVVKCEEGAKLCNMGVMTRGVF